MPEFQQHASAASRHSLAILPSSPQEPLQAALSTAAALAAASVLESSPGQSQEQGNYRRQSSGQTPTLQATSKSANVPSVQSQPFLTSQAMPAPNHHFMQKAIHHQCTQNHNPNANAEQHRIPQNRQQVFPLVYTQNTPNMITPNAVKNNPDGKSIFDHMHMKLRRGKWTQEEEAYAELLIQEFEKGTVLGCENGCTLRSFLSKKLHCAPMRISKKYAGKSIGKHVFLSRSAGNGAGLQEGNIDNATKLQDLEMKFYKSLFRESDAPGNLISYLPGHFGVAFPSVIHTAQPVQTSFLPFPSNSQAPVQPTQIRQALPWTMQSTATQPPVNTQNPLRQNYLSALNQRSVAAPTPIAPAPNQEDHRFNFSMSVAVNDAPSHIAPAKPVVSSNQVDLAPFQQSASTMQVQSHLQPRQEMNGHTGSQHNAPPYSHPKLQTPDVQQVGSNVNDPLSLSLVYPIQQIYQDDGKAFNKQQNNESHAVPVKDVPHHSQHGNIVCSPLDVPDFLSGFEKVVTKSAGNGESFTGGTSQSRIPRSVNEKTQSQYSPPFTSQSFDDFHQLLGKGLSPEALDLDNIHRGQQELYGAASNGTSINHQKERSVSADSYAIFAHQSALAVSHHSAYSIKAPAEMPAASLDESKDKNLGSLGPEITPMTTSVVNAANLRAHSLASKIPPIVSGSEKSEWGTSTEETESTVGYTGSGSDNASWNTSAGDNESDSSDSGPHQKKVKLSVESRNQTRG